METISDYYRDQNQQFHDSERERGKPWGQSGRKYYKAARDFAEELEAKTMLDYGCGSGTMKESFLAKNEYEIDIREYDPAIPHKAGMPKSADFVTCTDVMEHVEPQYIDNVLMHINSLATKGAFILVAPVRDVLSVFHQWTIQTLPNKDSGVQEWRVELIDFWLVMQYITAVLLHALIMPHTLTLLNSGQRWLICGVTRM